MTLKLTTWQRLQILVTLANLRGDLRVINRALKLIDIFEFSGEEKKEIDLREMGQSYVWKEEDKTWEIELEDQELIDFLKHCEQFGIRAE